MNHHADQTPGNKSQSAGHALSEEKQTNGSDFQQLNSAPGENGGKKLKEIANNSAQAKQLRAYQEKDSPA